MEMSRQRFDELVADALDLIPDEFATAMDNVVVLVEDRDPANPTLLGLYHGIALTERTSHYGGVLPDRTTAVHYVKFVLGATVAGALRAGGVAVAVGVDHPAYPVQAVLAPRTVDELVRDLE